MSIFREQPFDVVLEDASAGNVKTLQSEFAEVGQFPIVDQGKRLVAGFTDDANRLCRVPLPVILFGDHTRCFKYVDFPFCIGADGVKVLRSKIEADVKYLFHALNALHLPSAGYDRHFKHLRRTSLPIPALPEQRRIAAILDKADDLRAKRRAALTQLDGVAQSVFMEMFGDATSIQQGWSVVELGSVLEFLTSGSRGWATHYAESGELFLRIQNVGRDELKLDDVTYVNAPNTAEARRTTVSPGDVLLSITADLGRTAVVPEGIGRAYINQHLAVLRTQKFSPRFLSAYLASPSGQAQVLSKNRQGVKAGLNFDDIRSLRIPSPPSALQSVFSRRADNKDELERKQKESGRALDELFASLQHRAFRGEL